MSQRPFLSSAGAAGLWLASSAAKAADCGLPSALAVQVDVVSTPLPVKTDFREADLRAMSPGPHRHAPLGHYWNKVGYRLTVQVMSAPSACPAIAVRAQLVQVQQEIQVARELQKSPRLLKAIDLHYRRHAEAAGAALADVAAELPTTLRTTIAHLLATDAAEATLKNRIEAMVSAKLDQAVAQFTALGPGLRDKVDSPAEIGRLQAACRAV